MKKRLALALMLGVSIFLLSGCLVAPVVPPYGQIFTDYKAPLDYDQQASKSGADLKEGKAETMSVLGLVALGDASINTAAQNGGITVVHGADYEYFNVLGVYQRFTTVVRGE